MEKGDSVSEETLWTALGTGKIKRHSGQPQLEIIGQPPEFRADIIQCQIESILFKAQLNKPIELA